MRPSLLSFLTVLTLVCSSHSQVCQPKAGAYSERVSIERRYDAEVGNDYGLTSLLPRHSYPKKGIAIKIMHASC